MSEPAIILLAVFAVALIGMVILLLVPTAEAPGKGQSGGESICVETKGSIVTVRKVGSITSVYIHGGIADHWDGADGVSLGPLSPESTRLYEPALYDEYMSPSTSAIRKREIIDEVYSMGFTLPYIPGLYEQYKRELSEAEKDPDGKAATEHTPVNLTAGSEPREEPQLKTLEVNRALAQTAFSPMETGDDPSQDNK